MNNYLKYLPCLKDLEDSPIELSRADVPFSDMELCYIILNAIPYWLNCAYWAKQKANHFPMNVEKMTEELVRLEPHVGRSQQLVERATSQAKNASGKRRGTKRGLDSAIPRKSGENDKGQNEERQLRTGQKFCERCAKWHPAAANTHNTRDCRRFNAKGVNLFDARAKANEGKYGKARSTNAHTGDDSSMAQCFAQMHKDQMKVIKMLGKVQIGKKKKKRVVYESDSSDDSD